VTDRIGEVLTASQKEHLLSAGVSVKEYPSSWGEPDDGAGNHRCSMSNKLDCSVGFVSI